MTSYGLNGDLWIPLPTKSEKIFKPNIWFGGQRICFADPAEKNAAKAVKGSASQIPEKNILWNRQQKMFTAQRNSGLWISFKQHEIEVPLRALCWPYIDPCWSAQVTCCPTWSLSARVFRRRACSRAGSFKHVNMWTCHPSELLSILATENMNFVVFQHMRRFAGQWTTSRLTG